MKKVSRPRRAPTPRTFDPRPQVLAAAFLQHAGYAAVEWTRRDGFYFARITSNSLTFYTDFRLAGASPGRILHAHLRGELVQFLAGLMVRKPHRQRVPLTVNRALIADVWLCLEGLCRTVEVPTHTTFIFAEGAREAAARKGVA